MNVSPIVSSTHSTNLGVRSCQRSIHRESPHLGLRERVAIIEFAKLLQTGFFCRFWTHLPTGDPSVIFGQKATLLSKEVSEETCRNFSVLAGRSFSVGNQVITYLSPGPKGGPLVLWRTLDGVSIRPHPLEEYPAGQVPAKTPTRIFGVYTHAGQIAEYASFSAPMVVKEVWRVEGKKRTLVPNAEWFPHIRMVPIS